MSDGKDSLKDKPISRREFRKLMGVGSLFLGLGAFGYRIFSRTLEKHQQ